MEHENEVFLMRLFSSNGGNPSFLRIFVFCLIMRKLNYLMYILTVDLVSCPMAL